MKFFLAILLRAARWYVMQVKLSFTEPGHSKFPASDGE